MPRSLRLRLIIVALGWIALALLVAGLALRALLADFVTRHFDARLDATALALAAVLEFDDEGELQLGRAALDPAYDRALSGWYWQIGGQTGIVLKSRSLWTSDLPPGALPSDGGNPVTVRGPRNEALRALSRRITVPGGPETLRVVVAGPASGIADELAAIDPVVVWSLLALGGGLVAAIVLQVTAGLRPLDRLRSDLRDVRRGQRDRLPPTTVEEIAPVVNEINALLMHGERVVERSRTHVGNLAHSLQTPIAVLANEVRRKTGRRDAVIETTISQIERTAHHHLARARAAANHGVLGARTPVGDVVHDLAAALRQIHATRGIAIGIEVCEAAVFAGDRHDLEEMIGNLLDNACKWAAARVRVRARVSGQRLFVDVLDDGLGLSADEFEAALGRGVRLDEAAAGYGLGLAITRDLVELYGGALVLANGPEGNGLRLDLPTAAA